MIKKKSLRHILFLDIETASGTSSYHELSERMKYQWSNKAMKISRNVELTIEEVATLYLDKAAIFAEFSRIICISVGYLDIDDNSSVLKVKSFNASDELQLLSDFSELLNKHFNKTDKHFLCGHNIREFDCPVICRRMTILGLEFPKLLRIRGKKPWQVEHLLDTLEMWKFGDYKKYISLDLLSAVLGFPSPKDDIDGSMVTRVYWEGNGLDRITEYCQQDVVTTANVFLKMIRQNPIDSIKYISNKD